MCGLNRTIKLHYSPSFPLALVVLPLAAWWRSCSTDKPGLGWRLCVSYWKTHAWTPLNGWNSPYLSSTYFKWGFRENRGDRATFDFASQHADIRSSRGLFSQCTGEEEEGLGPWKKNNPWACRIPIGCQEIFIFPGPKLTPRTHVSQPLSGSTHYTGMYRFKECVKGALSACVLCTRTFFFLR